MTFKEFLTKSRDFTSCDKKYALVEYERDPAMYENMWEKFQQDCKENDAQFLNLLLLDPYIQFDRVRDHFMKKTSLEKRVYTVKNKEVRCLKVQILQS